MNMKYIKIFEMNENIISRKDNYLLKILYSGIENYRKDLVDFAIEKGLDITNLNIKTKILNYSHGNNLSHRIDMVYDKIGLNGNKKHYLKTNLNYGLEFKNVKHYKKNAKIPKILDIDFLEEYIPNDVYLIGEFEKIKEYDLMLEKEEEVLDIIGAWIFEYVFSLNPNLYTEAYGVVFIYEEYSDQQANDLLMMCDRLIVKLKI